MPGSFRVVLCEGSHNDPTKERIYCFKSHHLSVNVHYMIEI